MKNQAITAFLLCILSFLASASSASGDSVGITTFASTDGTDLNGVFTSCASSGTEMSSCEDPSGTSATSSATFTFMELIAEGEFSGGTSDAFASASVNDLLDFTRGLSRGHAFVVFDFFLNPFSDCETSNVSFSLPSGRQEVQFGTPFQFTMSGSASCTVGGFGGHPQAQILDMILEDIIVENGAGRPIRGVTLNAESGALYPLDASNTLPTPEANSFWLLGLGLIALLASGSSRRRVLSLSLCHKEI